MKIIKNKLCIGIIGLGYVGLPLAIEFGKKYKTRGFDLDHKRIKDLLKGVDRNNQIKKKEINKSKNLIISNSTKDLIFCNYYIITVPTPIHYNKKPDLSQIINATKLVSKNIKSGYLNINQIIISF